MRSGCCRTPSICTTTTPARSRCGPGSVPRSPSGPGRISTATGPPSARSRARPRRCAGTRERLHRTNRAGLSLWSARATALARGTGPTLTVPPAVLTEDAASARRAQRHDRGRLDLARLRRLVADAADDLGALDPEVARAWGFVGPGETPIDPGAVLALLPATDAAVTAATARPRPGHPGSGRAAAARGHLVAAARSGRAPRRPGHRARAGRARQRAVGGGPGRADGAHGRAGDARPHRCSRTSAPDVLGVDLGPVRQELRIAEHSFFLGRKGRLLTAAAPVLVHLRPGREIAPKELPARVEALATLTEQHRAVLAGWQALPGLGWLPSEAESAERRRHGAAGGGHRGRRRAGGRARPARPPGGRRDDRRAPGRARARRPRPRGRSPRRWPGSRRCSPRPAAGRSTRRRTGRRVCWRPGGRASRRALPTARTVGHSADGSERRRRWSRWPPICRKPAGSCSAVRSSGPTRWPRWSAAWPRDR